MTKKTSFSNDWFSVGLVKYLDKTTLFGMFFSEVIQVLIPFR